MHWQKTSLTLVILFVLSTHPFITALGGKADGVLERNPTEHTVFSVENQEPEPAGKLTQTVTFADLGYTSDETLRGILVTRDYTVRWPEAWEAQPENILTLNFSHSLALHERSSMAVDWNGTRLSSELLAPSNANNAALQVKIPGELIETGYNRLRLDVYMGIHDDFCVDLDNPAVWATIHSSSFFTFDYTHKKPTPDLGLFPLPFIDHSPMAENLITFVLPVQPTMAELNALAVISAKLGQLSSWRTLQINVLSESQKTALENAKGDLIFIGAKDRLEILKSETLPLKAIGQAGILWEELSPDDESAVRLFVTGANDKAVLTAARALASENAYPRLSGQIGAVLDVPAAEQGEWDTGPAVTLEGLGYQDATARGNREQILNYIIPIQTAWQSQSEGLLQLHFAHSELLHPERSSLSVLFNDTPVGSVLLAAENSRDGRATFHIPARLFKVGDNKLTIITDHRLLKGYEDPGDCLRNYLREAWLVVYADSQLDLPFGPTGLFLTLADYPPGFIGTANLSELAFIVPDTPTTGTGLAIARIAEGLGRFAKGKTLLPHVLDAKMLEEMDQPFTHQILIGRPSQNKAIADLDEALPQPFFVGSDQPKPIEKVAQIMAPVGSIGFIQAVLNPVERPVLVVTGTTDEGVVWAAEALNDPALVSKLRGDLAILDAPGSIVVEYIRSQAKPQFSIRSAGETVQPAAIARTSWIVWLSGFLFVLTLGLLGLNAWLEVKEKRSMREHYEKHTT